jgi:predicted AAA+ superfamily ATPase
MDIFDVGHRLFTMDPAQDIYGVKPDPDLFLRNNRCPLILDEIQYAPELIPAIKRHVDCNREPGQFVFTGSQQWHVLRHLSESLAGRIAVVDLHGFTIQEGVDRATPCWFNVWIETAPRGISESAGALSEGRSMRLSATETIWRGSFPEVRAIPEAAVSGWMQGYVTTYLQRDVRVLAEVREETQFSAFLSLCSALTAQECNYARFGKDLGLSAPAVKRWFGILRGTYQWIEIPAYSTNMIKRLSGRAKGHVADTGLACYLMRIASPAAIQGHPAFGALFESMVAGDCIKQTQCLSLPPSYYHHRQHSGSEVDVLFERDGLLFPVEIKASTRVSASDCRAMDSLRERLGPVVQPGLVVYAGSEVLRVGDHSLAVPFDLAL